VALAAMQKGIPLRVWLRLVKWFGHKGRKQNRGHKGTTPKTNNAPTTNTQQRTNKAAEGTEEENLKPQAP